MSENLRERIAKSLFSQDALRWPCKTWEAMTVAERADCYDDADAVIEALGLEVTVTAKSSDGRFRSFSIEGYWEEWTTDV